MNDNYAKYFAALFALALLAVAYLSHAVITAYTQAAHARSDVAAWMR